MTHTYSGITERSAAGVARPKWKRPEAEPGSAGFLLEMRLTVYPINCTCAFRFTPGTVLLLPIRYNRTENKLNHFFAYCIEPPFDG
jgi:hypothetical protein